MANEEEAGTDFSFLKLSPPEVLAARLRAGEFLHKAEIAKFLIEHPPESWPAELAEHVAALLEGTAKAPRGRPKNKYRAIETNQIQMYYPRALRVLQEDTRDIPEEFVEAVTKLSASMDPSLAPHDKAKSVTSMLVFGMTGYEKTVQERYRSK